MAISIGKIYFSIRQGIKSVEPVIFLCAGTYLLIEGIQKRNFLLGVAGGSLMFRGGVDLGKVIEETETVVEERV